MNKKELSQLYHLKHEIATERQRLAELENAAHSGQTLAISGMSAINSNDEYKAIQHQILESKGVIMQKLEQSAQEYTRLNNYIAGIEDCVLRRIFTLRYINGFSWRKAAKCIGGGNTADGVRKMHNRFLLR